MKFSPHQIKFLDTISQHGIEFSGHHWSIGHINLQPDQIELFTQDPDEFAAQYFKVTKSELLQWQSFISSWQCIGKTKTGNQCKGSASSGFRVTNPKLFGNSNPDCYCPKHKGQAE